MVQTSNKAKPILVTVGLGCVGLGLMIIGFQFVKNKEPDVPDKFEFKVASVPKCTLPNATYHYITGVEYCFTHLGTKAYKDGETSCRQLNAKLPLPKNNFENSYYQIVLEDFGIKQLSGGNGLILDMNDLTEEGVWTDSNGDKVKYTNWLPGQPDRNGGQHYASICSDFAFGFWGDWSADWEGIVVCQQEIQPKSPVKNNSSTNREDLTTTQTVVITEQTTQAVLQTGKSK